MAILQKVERIMAKKMINENEFSSEILVILKEEKGVSDALTIETFNLKRKLADRGVEFTNLELAGAIDHLICCRKIKLTVLCVDHQDNLGVEIRYPAE